MQIISPLDVVSSDTLSCWATFIYLQPCLHRPLVFSQDIVAPIPSDPSYFGVPGIDQSFDQISLLVFPTGLAQGSYTTVQVFQQQVQFRFRSSAMSKYCLCRGQSPAPNQSQTSKLFQDGESHVVSNSRAIRSVLPAVPPVHGGY